MTPGKLHHFPALVWAAKDRMWTLYALMEMGHAAAEGAASSSMEADQVEGT